MFSAVAPRRNFFPHTSRTETRALVYCNTQQLTQSVTSPRVWTSPHGSKCTALNTEPSLRSTHENTSYRQCISLSFSTLTLCKHIPFSSLYLPHSLTETDNTPVLFCSGQESAMNRYKPLYLKHLRKLQGNLHTEFQAQHLEGVPLYLGVGSTKMTTLLLALLQVSGKEEKQQRDH